MLRLNFVAVFLFSLLLFGTSFVPDIKYVINGVTYTMPKYDELIYYLKEDASLFSYYCKEVNPATSKCGRELYVLNQVWNSTKGFKRLVDKIDVAVFYPPKVNGYAVDVVTYNFPIHSLYLTGQQHLKILITIKQSRERLQEKGYGYNLLFEDPKNLCSGLSFNEDFQYNLNFYANKKSNKYAYYLIKNGNKICVYTFKFEDLFRVPPEESSFDTPPQPIQHVKFDLIEYFDETKYYAKNIYCVDPLYGTFVTLYWDKQPGHPPEAHYYLINENNLQNFYLIDRKPLPGMDEAILKAIFIDKLGEQFYPVFQCYGRQIFIWYYLRNEKHAFNGLWGPNETTYKVFDEELLEKYAEEGLRKIWHVKKDWIEYDHPVGRYGVTSLPPQLDFAGIGQKKVTPSYGQNDNKPSDQALNGSNECSNDDLYKWLLIVFSVVIVIEIIILVIVIILAYRGSKKMKEARARKRTLQPISTIKKMLTSEGKKNTKKESKQSAKEKTPATKTEDAGKTTDKKAKTGKTADKRTTTVDQTNYYTINDTFNKSTKKK